MSHRRAPRATGTMLPSLLAVLAVGACAEGVFGGQADELISAASRIDGASCAVVAQDETDGTTKRCLGHAGIPLFITSSGGLHRVSAGVRSERDRPPAAETTLGEVAEWRIYEQEPFAVILRYANADGPGADVLGVVKVGRRGAPGCIVAFVGPDPEGEMSMNDAARTVADAEAADFDCARPPLRLGGA